MKKKLFLGLAASSLAAVMCFGLAACDSKVDNDETQKDNTPEGPTTEVTTQVTAEEWAAAFSDESFSNYKVVATRNYEEVDGDKLATAFSEFIVTVADGKEHILMTIKEDGSLFVGGEGIDKQEEFYVDSTGSAPVYYAKNEAGEWEIAERINTTYLEATGMAKFYADAYASFVYDEELKGYVVPEGVELSGGLPGEGVIIKFEDGKLASWRWETVEEEEDGYRETTVFELVYTFGGQSVTLPEVKTEE